MERSHPPVHKSKGQNVQCKTFSHLNINLISVMCTPQYNKSGYGNWVVEEVHSI
jgi:hypothetical protein